MEWTIESTDGADAAHGDDLRRLEADCAARDGVSWPAPRDGGDISRLFFAKREGRTAGWLAVRILSAEAAEGTALVAPEYRRMGCLRALLDAAWKELERRKISDLRLGCDRRSDDGFEAAAALGGRLARWESTMECRPADIPRAEVGGIRLERCAPAAAARLARRIFAARPDAPAPWDGPAGCEWYEIFLIGAPVGVAAVARAGAGAEILRLGLLPEFRGQGLGTRVLSLLLRAVCAGGGTDFIRLKIDGGDTAARRLALSGGFRETAVTDYYRMAMAKKGEPE